MVQNLPRERQPGLSRLSTAAPGPGTELGWLPPPEEDPDVLAQNYYTEEAGALMELHVADGRAVGGNVLGASNSIW